MVFCASTNEAPVSSKTAPGIRQGQGCDLGRFVCLVAAVVVTNLVVFAQSASHCGNARATEEILWRQHDRFAGRAKVCLG